MNDREDRELLEIQNRLREWSESEPSLSEVDLRRKLPARLRDRRPARRLRVALVAAAAAMVAVLVGVQATRQPAPRRTVEAPEVIYDTGENVILVLRNDGVPMYVVKDVRETGGGTP
jgi:hypothetical protein